MNGRLWAALAGGSAIFVLWSFWSASPHTIETRMLDKTSAFLGAIRTGDRPTVLKLTVSDDEAREALNDDSGHTITGEFTVEPGALPTEDAEIQSFWAPELLEELARSARSPVTYSLNTNPDTPSIMLNFDCSRSTGKCLEHVKIFYTSRAGKISAYITFWNQPDWRALWKEFYSEGLVTKPCDDRCQF